MSMTESTILLTHSVEMRYAEAYLSAYRSTVVESCLSVLAAIVAVTSQPGGLTRWPGASPAAHPVDRLVEDDPPPGR
jgi:hypothetical protein